MPPAIKAYVVLPVTLHRMISGGKFKIRKQPTDPKATSSFDIRVEHTDEHGETVQPKFEDLKNYKAPNGLSMRPMTHFQEDLIKNYKGANVEIATLAENTELPRDLVLVHEWTTHSEKGVDHHYSLQPKKEMPFAVFERRVQEFLNEKSTTKTRMQWLLEKAPPVQMKGPNQEPVKWDPQAPEGPKWFYVDSKTKKVVYVPFGTKKTK